MPIETGMVSGDGGSAGHRPAGCVSCADVAAVQDAIRRAAAAGRAVRPGGAGQSWSSFRHTVGISVTVERLRAIAVHPGRRTVTAGAGARLGDVSLALARHGLCFPSLPFLAEMTVGGAVATASHGTSPRWGTMSDVVRAIDIVTASGERRHFDEATGPDALRAARVSVGLLGVIVSVELEAVPNPWVRPRSIDIALADLPGRLDALLDAHAHVLVRWTLGSERSIAACLETRPAGAPGFHRYVHGRNACWEAPSGLRSRLPRTLASVAVAASARWRRPPAPPFADARTPDAPVHASMQQALPRSGVADAIATIAGSAFAAANAGRVIEMKFVAGTDRSLLGPNTGADAVLFNAYWRVPFGRREAALRPFEDLMRPLGARPHWGKQHEPLDRAAMGRLFPGWNRFERTRVECDPGGMFSIFPDDR